MITESAVSSSQPRSKLKGFTLEINALDAEMSQMVGGRIWHLTSSVATVFCTLK